MPTAWPSTDLLNITGTAARMSCEETTRASIRGGTEPTMKKQNTTVGGLGAGTGARAETRLGGGSGKGRSLLGGGCHRERVYPRT
eukprot:6200535-Pleurochrysis_carterae.AAC.1